ncbi:response regulator transcription factor [Pedobacter suwonensis]|uniref:response regulator transcription factor n=1 Tax=Pedobacter suwonensis TaxID=332999 RepID=UPI0011A89A07|nr:response regulator [Pedobacter suwonensis]
MPKILVVDDDPGNAEVMQMVLESEGFQVKRICQSIQLEPSMTSFCPDLVLMDILLDANDGRDICNDLKADRSTSHIPVMLITAMLESQVSNIACDADDIMFKPFDYAALVNKVKNVLRRASTN